MPIFATLRLGFMEAKGGAMAIIVIYSQRPTELPYTLLVH